MEQGNITGQAVEIAPKAWAPDSTPTRGHIVGYVMGVGAVDGFVEERCRVVVQTDAGRIVFYPANEIRVLEPVAV